MTWAWILLWIAVGLGGVGAFVAGAADEGRRTQLELRSLGVRYASTPWSAAADAAVLAWLAAVYTATGAFALIAGATNAARRAADAGAARVSEPSIADKER